MIPIVKNNPAEHYLNIWPRVFKSEEIKSECGNIPHIIEILLCVPFSNAKLERMFSRMAHVKNDYRNRLGKDLLDACLRVSEEGCDIASFNTDSAISVGTKRKKDVLLESHVIFLQRENKCQVEVVDIVTITLPDLEDSDEEFTGFGDDLRTFFFRKGLFISCFSINVER